MTTKKQKLPSHFFISSSDGALFDTRKPNWHKGAPLRRFFQGLRREIENTQHLKACLRNPCTPKGCYELVYLASDGEILCSDCVRKNLRNVLDSIKNNYKDGWKVTNCLYEATSAEIARECNPDLVSYCASCNKEFGEVV